MNRRHFIATLLALTTLPRAKLYANNTANSELIIGAQGAWDDTYSCAWLGDDVSMLHTVLSGFRGHDVCQHALAPEKFLMFSRRPGTQVIEVDTAKNTLSNSFKATKNRHFYGHGDFAKNGEVLFTSEADIVAAKGKIGIRDAKTYQHLGEYESHGVGPHQLALMPDGNTLVVANGGILTHPNTGRKKLNLDTMVSSLSYIDVQTGRLLEAFHLPESKSSIRHLDVSADGTVAFGIQFQRKAAKHDRVVPLAGIHRANQPLQLLTDERNITASLNDYVGSVAVNTTYQVAGFTSPRGNRAVFWDMKRSHFKGLHDFRDVCGIALSTTGDYFVLSNSYGQIRYLHAATLQEDKTKRISLKQARWDNHLHVSKQAV